MMQEARTSLLKGLTPAQVISEGVLQFLLKGSWLEDSPNSSASPQGPWGSTTVTSTPVPRSPPRSPESALPPTSSTLDSQAITGLAGQGPGEPTTFSVLLWLCARVVPRHTSLHIQPPCAHSSLTPSQPGTVPRGSHKAWHTASTQGCWGDFLSSVSSLDPLTSHGAGGEGAVSLSHPSTLVKTWHHCSFVLPSEQALKLCLCDPPWFPFAVALSETTSLLEFSLTSL